jgi:lysophospholipase L1-like esterase
VKKILCFGDTSTEMGAVIELRGFVAQLMDRYVRRADVLLRGFTGYTTREALRILKTAVLDERPDFVVLFFGTNDSALPGQIQHVPVAEYRENLQRMATEIVTAGAWILFVTPPPVDERRVRSRTMDHTALYAQACREVAEEMRAPLVDLFERLQREPDWAKKCLLEGLHLSSLGMNILYEELARALDGIKPLDQFDRLQVDGI